MATNQSEDPFSRRSALRCLFLISSSNYKAYIRVQRAKGLQLVVILALIYLGEDSIRNLMPLLALAKGSLFFGYKFLLPTAIRRV